MRRVILAVFADATHPAVNRGARSLARALVAAGLADSVSVAFELGEPNFHRILDLLEPGPVTVLPVTVEMSQERRRTLSQELARNRTFSQFEIEFAAPLGASPRFREALGAHLWEHSGPEPEVTTVVLVGPGAPALAQALSLLDPAGRILGFESEGQVWDIPGPLVVQPVLYPLKGRFHEFAMAPLFIQNERLVEAAADCLLLAWTRRKLRVPEPVALALAAV